MKTNNSFNGSIIAGGNVTRSNNGNHNSYKDTNVVIKQVRKEAIIISFVVGFLSSILASYLYEILF